MPIRLPSVKSFLPRSFFGRAVLIVVVPIIVIQIVLSIVFVQRHYERVAQQLTGSVLDLVGVLVARVDSNGADSLQAGGGADLALALDAEFTLLDALPDFPRNEVKWFDLAGQEVLAALKDEAPNYLGAVLRSNPDRAELWVATQSGPLQVTIPRNRLAPANPHQLLVIVFTASLVMVVIALQYLRLQIRPIRRLGAAAEAYGRGQSVPLRATGASEIRAAALAFIDMRSRLARQNAQRKLMLSGLGHDMRTPLTRMRLQLSMVEPSEDFSALKTEITDLEKLLDAFLDYAKGEEPAPLGLFDPKAIATDIVGRYKIAGKAVELTIGPGLPPRMLLREGQLGRALDNILGNALDYGGRAHVELKAEGNDLLISVDDDGPGIAPTDRTRACEPFVRLDPSRNQNAGSHVGLGLAIAHDILRAHGGRLLLDDAPILGGLRATLRLPIDP